MVYASIADIVQDGSEGIVCPSWGRRVSKGRCKSSEGQDAK